jgi:2-iminobutanoate/2-iminopropanoate deaminase
MTDIADASFMIAVSFLLIALSRHTYEGMQYMNARVPEKHSVSTSNAAALPKHFSPAIVGPASGRLVFISGMTAKRPDGSLGDPGEQTVQVCENLASALAAAGGTLADVCEVTVFLRNIDDYQAVNSVRQQFFPAPPPASTLVEVSRFVNDDYLVEINAIAIVPE